MIALAFVGCDSAKHAELKGAVTYNGKAIDKGSIRIFPADGEGTTDGAEIVAGAYHAKKVPLGIVKIQINYPKAVDKRKMYEDDPKSPERIIWGETLPDHYAKAEETKLQFDVKPGMNVKNWDLKD